MIKIALFLITLSSALALGQPANDEEVQRLREENAALKSEIEELKKKLASLPGEEAAKQQTPIASPTEADVARLKQLYAEVKAGRQQKTAELAALKRDIQTGLVAGKSEWSTKEFESRVALDKKIAAVTKAASDSWTGLKTGSGTIPQYASSAKTVDEFLARLLAIEKIADGTYATLETQDGWVTGAVEAWIQDHSEYRSPFAKLEFLRWLKEKGVRSRRLGTMIEQEAQRQKQMKK